MQNKTKNDGIIGGAIAHSARGLTKNGYHRCCKFKEKAIWEEEILMLWIFLSRNASTNTKSFYHNSWEMKFILSTQGASRAALFFSPLNVRECFFSYLYALPGYTVYMYIFFLKSTSPSPQIILISQVISVLHSHHSHLSHLSHLIYPCSSQLSLVIPSRPSHT